MSPVLILSRLCLNRRFQFLGISETSSCRTARTFLIGLLVDDPAQTGLARVLARDHDGHVVVEDLDREVLLLLTEDVLVLLLDDLPGAVMRVDDGVADLEVDALGLGKQVLQDVSSMSMLRREWWSSWSWRAVSGRRSVSRLQVAVHEVDLLQPAKALADVLRPDLADALDRLELGVRRGEDAVEAAELAHDLADDELRQARDAPEDPVAARRDGIVERVELAVVAQDLGQAAEVEQVLVRQAAELVERGGERLVGRRRRCSRGRAPACRRRRRPSSPRAASR